MTKNQYLESESESESEDEIDIHEVTRTGTYKEVKAAIARDRPRLICKKDKFGRLAIHYAVALDRIDITNHLISKQSNIDAKDKKEQTPLHLAASKGLSDMCRLLLENKANINLRDKECWNALHHAVDGRYYETATVLVKRGIDLKAEDHRHGRTALHIAAEKGYSEIVEMLIIRGADMYASGDSVYSKTPLHLACMYGHVEATRVLVEREADPAAMSGFLDKTPLHLACEEGHLECATIVASTGTYLDIVGNRINGSTPLHLAAERNHLDIVRMLVEKGASIEQWGRYTVAGPALHTACQHDKIEAVKLLLELGAQIDHRDINGHTPLHIACKHGSYDIAIFLLHAGADHRVKAMNGRTAYDYISVPTIKEKIKVISDQIDLVREEKERAIAEAKRLEAIRLRKEEKLRLEQEAAAERERIYLLKRKETFTALLRAAADVSGELSALMLVIEEYPEQNYDCVIVPETNSTALTAAAQKGFHPIIHKLLQWPGIDLNHQDSSGNTALHYAAMVNDRELVEELLLAGVKTGLVNSEGRVAVNYAKASYLQEVMRNPSLVANKARYQSTVQKTVTQHTHSAHSNTLSIADSTHLVPYPDSPASSPNKTLSDKKHSVLLNVTAAKLLANGAAHSVVNPAVSRVPIVSSGNKSAVSAAVNSAKVVNQFGEVPLSFGGCRADFFNLSASAVTMSNNNQLTSSCTDLIVADPTTSLQAVMDVFALQRSYLPNSFDSTAEFCEVKDFLWLIGHPYKPRRSSVGAHHNNIDSGPESGLASPKLAENSFLDGAVGFDNTLEGGAYFNTSMVESVGDAQQEDVSALTDKKYFMYVMALAMNDLQLIFTNTKEHLPVEQTEQFLPPGVSPTHQRPADPAPPPVVLPPISNPLQDKLIGSTVGTKYLHNTDKLPTISGGRGAVQSYVSESESYAKVPHNISCVDSCGASTTGNKRSLSLSSAANSTDYTHHYKPDNITAADFVRLVQYTKQVDFFLDAVFALFEPELYGWPLASAAGGEFSVYDKIALLSNALQITPEVEQLLYNLVTYSYSHNNEQYCILHEYTQEVARAKQARLQKSLRYTEVRTSDFNIFAQQDNDESAAAGAKEQDEYYVHRWELYSNPPRYMRLIVDTVFDVAHFVSTKAETVYPLDSVRAHLWAHSGRVLIETKLSSVLHTVSVSALELWLSDMQLQEYGPYFAQVGFKLLSDFVGLSEQDCRDYFPFLKIGDLRRLVKFAYLLTDETLRKYEKKAKKTVV